jgi:hypothetical protein
VSRVILLGFIVGILKAVRDTIAHHFDISVFHNLPGWLYQFMQSDPMNSLVQFTVFNYPVRIDGWHVSDWLLIGCLFILSECKSVWRFAIFVISATLAFVLFYHHLLLF